MTKRLGSLAPSQWPSVFFHSRPNPIKVGNAQLLSHSRKACVELLSKTAIKTSVFRVALREVVD